MTILVELFEAIAKLGIPVFAVSWWAIHRRYKKGDITLGADRKTIKTDLKAYRKKWRSGDKKHYSLLENKWMRFGGGFYGITALTTFLLIELGEVLSFLGDIANIGALFDDGLIQFVINVFVNQLQNFISAIVWFAYWTEDDRSIVIWLAVPYAAYLLGIKVAVNAKEKSEEVLGDETALEQETGQEMEGHLEGDQNLQPDASKESSINTDAAAPPSPTRIDNPSH